MINRTGNPNPFERVRVVVNREPRALTAARWTRSGCSGGPGTEGRRLTIYHRLNYLVCGQVPHCERLKVGAIQPQEY